MTEELKIKKKIVYLGGLNFRPIRVLSRNALLSLRDFLPYETVIYGNREQQTKTKRYITKTVVWQSGLNLLSRAQKN